MLEGSLQEAEFAAHLTKVMTGTAPPEYQDPALFFERAYITEGMALLLDGMLKRLSGRGGDPVVQLKTSETPIHRRFPCGPGRPAIFSDASR